MAGLVNRNLDNLRATVATNCPQEPQEWVVTIVRALVCITAVCASDVQRLAICWTSEKIRVVWPPLAQRHVGPARWRTGCDLHRVESWNTAREYPG